ncbi:MAG: hypothetical protein ACD_23C01190G0003 [uncultured bacterium]|nr:MAG: hypothetical protein ACD_23C01190G0003 [uncultured bacterium]
MWYFPISKYMETMLTDDWIVQAPDSLRLAASPVNMDKGQSVFRFGDEVDAVYRVLELGASHEALYRTLAEMEREGYGNARGRR